MCMIKARIGWCSCRVENILTLGKLLRLWFCFLLHSILFFISQTSYHTYKIISSYELARPIMGTIFLDIGERAKRARHSQVCSIENRGYIYYYIIVTVFRKTNRPTRKSIIAYARKYAFAHADANVNKEKEARFTAHTQ